MTETREALDRYYGAMRRGADAENEMMALFAHDAIYSEPFSGSPEPAIGRGQIRDRMRAGWATPLPDLELDVLSVELTGSTAVCTWECRSTAFPAPVQGCDEYHFAGGLIQRLIVTITTHGPA